MKNKDKKKSNVVYYIAVGILLIAIAILAIYIISVNGNKNEENRISYTDIIKSIEEGTVEKIEMTVGSTSIKVKLKDEEKEKGAIIPSTQAFIELVQENVKDGKSYYSRLTDTDTLSVILKYLDAQEDKQEA